MKETVFPFKCDCNIEINKFGHFELTLSDLPHPTEESGTNNITVSGRTLGEAFFNMGHYSMLLLEEQFPGLLDSVVAEALHLQHSP